MMKCTLCETELLKKIDSEYYQCSTCKAYVKDEELWYSTDKEKHHYEQHNNDINDLGYQKFTAPVTNFIVDHLSNDSLGLDYGCGKGPVITEQLKKKGYKIDLYDPYFYPNETYLNKSYDYIFSCEVFEHFYNPKDELFKLKNILKKNGLLIVKTHLFIDQADFTNWYYRKDQTHVFIYTYKTVEYIAKKYNFEIITLEEKLFILKNKA